MAIVHVAFKSSSNAPPAAAHADYIARHGKYKKRGDPDLVESGNLPEFAQADARAFWVAADAHERANGRTYTELQLALPRELGKAQREELAQEAAREFLGDRFAYTLAIHNPVAKDKIDQPHLHLMFSERVIDASTRELAEDRFFKRNGAKKDRETWHGREKPEEIRVKWCAMMNAAMEREGIEERVDPRSWADQGREDLSALVEPKTLGGRGEDAKAIHQQIEQRRQARQMLGEQERPEVVEARIAAMEQDLNTQLAEIDRRMEVERAKQRAEQAAVQGREERELQEAIEHRARQIWEASEEGRAAMTAAERYEDDRLQEAAFQRLFDEAVEDLTDWKAAHPLKSMLGHKERQRLEDDVESWRIKFNQHHLVCQRSHEGFLKHEAIKKTSWPEILKQAAAELKKILMKLMPEQVLHLLQEQFGQDRKATDEAWRKVEQGTHSVEVLGGLVQVYRNPEDQENYVGALLPRDKKALEDKLTEIQRQESKTQERAPKVVEQPSREVVTRKTVASGKVPSREELDRQLRRIAKAKGFDPNARIVPGEKLERSEITGRVLGYTARREEMLLERLSGQLVRVPWGGQPELRIGEEIDIDPRNGRISRGGFER